MRAVLDTNVLISGFRSDGPPKVAVEMAVSRIFTLVISDALLLELDDVLENKFGWNKRLRRNALQGLRAIGDLVTPSIVVTDCIDPDDNRILEAAVEGKADCIVSGDRHLLRMGTFRGVEIVTVVDFLVFASTDPGDV